MSRTDIVQLVLGLLTPPLLIAHLTATHFAYQGLPDLETNYGMLLTVYWVHAPFYAFQQLFVVLIVWVHAALGLYAWLVVQAVWRRIGGFVLPLLFAVPILALIGFADAGNEVLAKYANDAEWRAATGADAARVVKFLADTAVVQSRVFTGWCLLVLVVAGVLAARMLFARSQTVEVAYDAGLVARGRRGLSILELSEAGGIPHARVCSARGRCGTCRVRIDAGAASLSPPNDIEQATLARVKAGEGVRLACQTRVLAAGVAVTRLLPAYADASAAREPLEWVSTEDHAAPAGPGAANPASAP
jgi:adenylate cyclase